VLREALRPLHAEAREDSREGGRPKGETAFFGPSRDVANPCEDKGLHHSFPTGLERCAKTPVKPQVSEKGGAKSGVLPAHAPEPGIDPDLKLVMSSWPGLPAEIRAAILALTHAVTGAKTTREESSKQRFHASSPGSRGKG
jgi:hypothetical protein